MRREGCFGRLWLGQGGGGCRGKEGGTSTWPLTPWLL